jgi:hypothetical protein
MQVMQGGDLLAIVKTEGKEGRKADHMLVVVPTTISKVADKAMIKEFEDVYKTELMPQQVGVGVKFAAKLLAMGLWMTLHVHDTFVLITIDLKNAYIAMRRAAVCEAHLRHDKLRRTIPYWRATLGPHSLVWAGAEEFWGEDGLNQGSPSSSSGFSWTIHGKVKQADERLEVYGGCARFGMDDGYMAGPRDVIFAILKEFAEGVEADT